jgi:hypothetical protein
MFHGGFNTLMQMVGMARIVQDEEFQALCAAQRPRGGWRQYIAQAWLWLRQTIHNHQPVTQSECLRLTQASQALEARIVALEHQVTAVLPLER